MDTLREVGAQGAQTVSAQSQIPQVEAPQAQNSSQVAQEPQQNSHSPQPQQAQDQWEIFTNIAKTAQFFWDGFIEQIPTFKIVVKTESSSQDAVEGALSNNVPPAAPQAENVATAANAAPTNQPEQILEDLTATVEIPVIVVTTPEEGEVALNRAPSAEAQAEKEADHTQVIDQDESMQQAAQNGDSGDMIPLQYDAASQIYDPNAGVNGYGLVLPQVHNEDESASEVASREESPKLVAYPNTPLSPIAEEEEKVDFPVASSANTENVRHHDEQERGRTNTRVFERKAPQSKRTSLERKAKSQSNRNSLVSTGYDSDTSSKRKERKERKDRKGK